MQQYELMLMLLPNLGEKALGEAVAEIEDFISSMGGKISQEDVWGVRDLAYRIKKHDQGYYIVWILELPAASITEMEKTLNINANIMRYLLLKTPQNYSFKTLTQLEAEAEAAAKEAAEAKNENNSEPSTAPKEPKKEEVKKDKLASIIDDPDINL
ncbi:30S ribosomal protein S6 [Candidatus Gracilibacteria bacterium]|nr:30S ribosomal protein S6 [Candidatus Gracilibacteria bacterium]